jgi:hypothetical protein
MAEDKSGKAPFSFFPAKPTHSASRDRPMAGNVENCHSTGLD